jgi:5-methylthioadenosine/S-adenosylhomocysteine deaminase
MGSVTERPRSNGLSERYVAEHLLTQGGEQPGVVSPGVVDVEGDTVMWSGPADEAPVRDGVAARRLTGLLMPGFVNTHCHTPMILLRGAGEGLPVSRWLVEVMWPREGKLTPEDVFLGMSLGAAELLRNGITTTHEMYFHSDAVAQAAVAAGLRCVVTQPLLVADDLASFGDWDEQIEAMVDQVRRWSGHELITVGFGPHSAYAVPEELLREVAELAKSAGVHIQIHLAEAAREGDVILEKFGISVPTYLDRVGLFESLVVAAHAVWLDRDDIELLAARGAGVAHCPSSNGKHASGIAPVVDMRKAGVKVGLGTDGPASHDRLDIFEDMRWAVRLARLRAADAGALGPLDALTMATSEGAAVLGRSDLGHLGAGAKADMVLIDTDGLMPIVEEPDLLTHLVYSGSPEAVRHVWVGGRQVVEDRHVLTVDVSTLRTDVTARARTLAAR